MHSASSFDMTFIAVCCGSCGTFMSTQERKDSTFKCVVCGKKNSVRHVFKRSESNREVRPVVQELNFRRVKRDEENRAAAARAFDDATSPREYVDSESDTSVVDEVLGLNKRRIDESNNDWDYELLGLNKRPKNRIADSEDGRGVLKPQQGSFPPSPWDEFD